VIDWTKADGVPRPAMGCNRLHERFAAAERHNDQE